MVSAENVQWLDTQGQPMTVAQWQNPDLKAMQIVLDNQWLFLINTKERCEIFSCPMAMGNDRWCTPK